MKKQYYLFLFLLVLFTCTGSLQAQQAIVISPSTGLVDVCPNAGTLLDEADTITVQGLASGKYNKAFEYKGKAVVSYGISRGTSWCVFSLCNKGSERVFISVNNPIADSIRLYAIKDGMAIQIGVGSLSMPVSSRQVYTENNMFDLKAGPDTTTYLLAFKNSRNHVYSLTAGYLTQHMVVINRTSLWNAIFIGFALLMALYHIFLFIAIRNIPYLYYVGYVVCFALFNAHLNGSSFLFLWPQHPEWNYYDNLFSCASGFFSAYFAVTCLDLRKHAPSFRKAVILMAWLYAADAAISLLGYSYAAFIIIRQIIPVWLVITITAAYTVLRRGYKPARFFLIAWLVMVVGVLIFMFNSFNIIQYCFLTAHSLQIAALIEALVLSFALADRFNTYKKEKEALMRTQNEMLEQKVSERTDELKKQQQETEQLLLNILPEEVAAELKENGVARSRNYEAVTVLFTDFKDFTHIVENISPEQLIAELNHCFSAFDKIIEKYNIEKIKTIGDSYMCAGGLGSHNPQNATDVVKAGIEIRNFITHRNQQEKSRGGNILEVRIGIHTGPVIAGIIGIKKFAYDIWGDTVNIASRMESAGETGKVNISGITYELVKGHFDCTYRGRIPAKNKGEVDMYFAEWKA